MNGNDRGVVPPLTRLGARPSGPTLPPLSPPQQPSWKQEARGNLASSVQTVHERPAEPASEPEDGLTDATAGFNRWGGVTLFRESQVFRLRL